MKNNLTNEELEQALLEVVEKINRKRAIKGEPYYTLDDMLAKRSVTALKKLAKLHGVKGYSKMDREELTAAVLNQITKPDRLREIFYILDQGEWDFFKEVAAVKQLQENKVYIDTYQMLQDIGLLSLYWHDGKFNFVVPDEIRSIYTELNKTDFPVERDYYYLLNQYAIAATNLYGVISQDDFVDLFNSQNERKTNIDEMFPILLKYVYQDFGYCFWDEYIVNDDLEENDFEDVEYYAKTAGSKPRYMPLKEEFLKYADWDYYEVTPQVINLKNFLEKKLHMDIYMADVIIDELHEICLGDFKPQEVIDILEENEVELSFQRVKEVLPLVMEMSNHTRIWLNNGHTPNEMLQEKNKHLRVLPAGHHAEKKIGRNDPCPCGSGKKYKKCCYLKLN